MPSPFERLKEALTDRYAIERELGRGGMATVYLAHDSRHGRRVALKVLKPELAAVLGAERFLQEIRVTAHLQHPHILPLHDSGEADSFLYYVMPYVEGESLRDKLNREKQLEIHEALRIAQAVAAALDYAHRHRVIHRDIKPENILLHDGQPSIADFGIALAVQTAGGQRLTETGFSLGTPQYMSPEQAMADRELDARSDVYSLGVVLYEMLTGDPPYTASTAQAIVARVITERPPLITTMRETVPRHVAAAIHTALARLPADRFSSAAEFGNALVTPAAAATRSEPEVQEGGPTPQWLGWRAAAVVLMVVVVLGVAARAWSNSTAPTSRGITRFVFPLPPGIQPGNANGNYLAMSPDGRLIVYVGMRKGQRQLFLRRLDQLDLVPIPNTEGGAEPFFSPDGAQIGFLADGKIKRVPLTGGPAVVVCQCGTYYGATWGSDNTIVFALDGKLRGVRASGGEPVQVASFETGNAAQRTLGYRWPHFLPDGKHVLVTVWAGDNTNARIGSVDVGSGTLQIVTEGGTNPYYVEPNRLVYALADGTIMAAPFDPRRRRTTGSATPLLEAITLGSGGMAMTGWSRSGSVTYQSSGGTRRLVLVDRTGTPALIADDRRYAANPRFSPNGDRVAVAASGRGTSEVWIVDLRRATSSRLTFGSQNTNPDWSPDGRSVMYTNSQDLLSMSIDGGGPVDSMVVRPGFQYEGAHTHQGTGIVYREGTFDQKDLYYLPSAKGTPEPLVVSPFDDRAPAVSPDDRYLAYASNASGRHEVYVRAFPRGQGRWQISTAGGMEPRWSRDGHELFYRSADTVFAVAIRTQPSFTAGRPLALFVGPYLLNADHAGYDVHPDGKHFVFVENNAESQQFVVVEDLLTQKP